MDQVKNFGFMLEMGNDIGLFPGKGEEELHYAERVILSAGACWMLTAVHNLEKRVSVENIKNVAREKIESYLGIIDHPSSPDVNGLVNEIYEMLKGKGMFYHEQYYVLPVRHREIGAGSISFVRGLLPEEDACFSGMAPFVRERGVSDLADEFMLWSRNGPETIECAWQHSFPQEESTSVDEYLRIHRGERDHYYAPRREDDLPVTMGRTRRSDGLSHDYYMIKGKEIRRLTDDYLTASVHEYVRTALMNQHGGQLINAHMDDHLVRLDIGYLLPRPDALFLKYVSWPESLQDMNKKWFYHVSLQPAVWPAIRERLLYLGYQVEETHE